MKRTLCFEYYSIIVCGLTELNTWTFESLKKIFTCMQVNWSECSLAEPLKSLIVSLCWETFSCSGLRVVATSFLTSLDIIDSNFATISVHWLSIITLMLHHIFSLAPGHSGDSGSEGCGLFHYSWAKL